MYLKNLPDKRISLFIFNAVTGHFRYDITKK